MLGCNDENRKTHKVNLKYVFFITISISMTPNHLIPSRLEHSCTHTAKKNTYAVCHTFDSDTWRVHSVTYVRAKKSY